MPRQPLTGLREQTGLGLEPDHDSGGHSPMEPRGSSDGHWFQAARLTWPVSCEPQGGRQHELLG